MEIYIHRDGQQFGPYSVEQTRDYIASGNLTPDDLAWHEGVTDWVPLAQVTEVTGAFNAPPPSAIVPAQGSQRDWIPPRRTANPSPSVATPAQTPVNVMIDKTLAEPDNTTAGVAPGNVKVSAQMPSPAIKVPKRTRWSIGTRNMFFGALWFIGGSAVTAYSYEAAAESPGGGTYFFAWGAILFGGIQFVKGLLQFSKE